MLRPFGARVPKKRSRATPLVRFFFTTFLRLLKLLLSFFIATAKTSYTAMTLYATPPKFCGKYGKYI
jgi:hypothetical protein